MADDRQAYVDAFYAKRGPCCAGCDFWRWINTGVGECIRIPPNQSHDAAAGLGMHGVSLPVSSSNLTRRELVAEPTGWRTEERPRISPSLPNRTRGFLFGAVSVILAPMTSTIKSTAAHVLSTGEATDEEAKSLAAYALGDASPARTVKSFDELQALLNKIEGVEGQKERADAIRATMERMS